MLREVTERGAVDDGRDHLGGGGRATQVGVVVANGDRGNLGVDIKEDVAVEIGNAAVL